MENLGKLEEMFQKTDSNLESLNKRLDEGCKQVNEKVLDKAEQDELLQKISDIKSEYRTIVEDAKQIQKIQIEAVKFFQETMVNACRALMKLQENGGIGAQAERPEELDKLEQLLGMTTSITQSTGACSSTPAVDQFTDLAVGDSTSASQGGHTQRLPSIPSEPENSSHLKPYAEITDEQFLSVSDLVRGRVKLMDVNMTYRVLWQHFSEPGNRNALSPADMHRMGLEVTGKTGEAKLQVLRVLKLASISRTGDVMLL